MPGVEVPDVLPEPPHGWYWDRSDRSASWILWAPLPHGTMPLHWVYDHWLADTPPAERDAELQRVMAGMRLLAERGP